jgi:predicted permease
LLARPGFTLIAVLTLALGIGANTAIFGLYQQLVARPLPVPAPGELVNLSAPGPKWGSTSNSTTGPREEIFSYPMWRDLESGQSTFQGIAAHRNLRVNLAFQGQTQAGLAMMVSSSYFSVLGLNPVLGRLLGAQDGNVVGEPRVAVLSHAYWQNQLGARTDVVGQPIKVNGETLTVIGVAAPGFSGTTTGFRAQVFVPLTLRWLLTPGMSPDHDNRKSYWLYLFARLKPGSDIESASSDINRLYQRLINDVEVQLNVDMDATTMAQFKAKSIVLTPGERGQSSLSRNAATPVLLLMAVATLVLLIACMNTANLLLARASRRAGELALRVSIGASRARLLRQHLVESLLLALLGGLAGLPIAKLCLVTIVALLPPDAAGAMDPVLDMKVMLYALAVGVTTVLLFGLFPALQAARTTPIQVLKGSTGGSGTSRVASHFRNALATAQIALSMVSLVLAGLFIQSLQNLSRVEIGMQVDALATFSISPARNGYPPERSRQLFDQLEQDLAQLPGVTAVTTSIVTLLTNDAWGTNVSVEGFDSKNGEDASVLYNEVGSSYFETVGLPLLAGRGFSDADSSGRPKVAIVNQRFAEQFGLGNDVRGKRMAFGDKEELDIEIIGLVSNAHYDSVKSAQPAQYFVPRRQNSDLGELVFYVRSALPPKQLLASLPAVVAKLDPDLPVENLRTVSQQIRENLVIDHFVGMLSTAFALLATLLAAIGVYGVLAYTLEQRTREIGLRLALGAAPQRVQTALLGQVGRMFLIGGGIGLVLALALGRAAQVLLYQLDGHDPQVLLGATLLLALIALLAGWWPARRAARIDPLVALRWE